MTLLKSRDLLVRTRTRLTNAIRGVMKAVGLRLPSAGGTRFPSKTALLVPEELKPSLLPLLETISHLNKQIYQFDKAIERVARENYPETGRLRQISGVGPVTSLQYVLTIGDPSRFAHSRDVGAYLGLTPRRRQSGDIEQQLRISKAGKVSPVIQSRCKRTASLRATAVISSGVRTAAELMQVRRFSRTGRRKLVEITDKPCSR